MGSNAANTKPRHPMQITSGQQYNVGEKPTVILYIFVVLNEVVVMSVVAVRRTLFDMTPQVERCLGA